MLKKCAIKMGSQGLLLLMELKFLTIMRPQNTEVTVTFCSLAIITKNFNSINSRRHQPPILTSYLFSMAFSQILGCNFLQGCFLLHFHFLKIQLHLLVLSITNSLMLIQFENPSKGLLLIAYQCWKIFQIHSIDATSRRCDNKL